MGFTALCFGVGSTRLPVLALAVPLVALFIWVCLQDLSAGLAVFTALTFFEQFGAVGAGSLSAIKAAGLILAFAWGVQLLDRRRDTPFLLSERPLLAWSIVALLFIGAASSVWAGDSDDATEAALRLLQVVVLVFVAFSAVRGATDLKRVLLAFTGGSLLAGLIGLVSGATYESTDRLSGGISDPNFLAAVVVAGVLIATFLALSPGQPALLRLLLLPLIGLGLVTIFQTESRGGLVSLAVGLVVVLLVAGPVRARTVALALLAGALAVGYFAFAVSTQSRERVADITEQGSSGRTDQWQIAAEMFADHPLLGVGLANFPDESPAYTAGTVNLILVEQLLRARPVVHNTYLEVAAELGVGALAIMLLLFLGSVAVAVRTLRATAGRIEPAVEIALRALIAATVALLVAYFFLSGLYEKQLWLLLGLLLGAATVAKRQAAR
jgi:putative inorganic carbon (hco3(-)) transporter